MLFESLVENKKFTSKVVFIVLIYTTMIVLNKNFGKQVQLYGMNGQLRFKHLNRHKQELGKNWTRTLKFYKRSRAIRCV